MVCAQRRAGVCGRPQGPCRLPGILPGGERGEFDNIIFDKLKEGIYPKHYCGVFGVYGHPNAAELTYYGLYALQHRGQESAGIVANDGRQFRDYRRMGLVSQIFNGEVLHELVGTMAIGHTRYSTTGSSHLRNAQPMIGTGKRGQIAVAHNGNLTNAAKLREELEDQGIVFTTTVDSELILPLLSQPTLGG